MIVAGRNTMYGESSSGKPPWDWSMDTAMALRLKFRSELQQVTTMPQLVATTTISCPSGSFSCRPLTTMEGKLGAMMRTSTNSSDGVWTIIDPVTGQTTQTDAVIPSSSSNHEIRTANTIDGKIMVESRYQGKVYVMNEDGTGLTYIGQTNTAHNTNDSFRLFPCYDGTVADVDAGTRTYYVIDQNYNITKKTNLNTQYPHRFIKVPGYIATASYNGYLSIWNEEYTSQLVANRSVSSYFSLSDCFKVAPGQPTKLYFGARIKSSNVGIDLLTLTNITTSQSYMGVDGQRESSFLPTGQWFYYRNGGDGYGSWHGLYDPINDAHQRFNVVSGNVDLGSLMTMLGGLVVQVQRSSAQVILRVYDFGFNKKYYPQNLITGPFGYNVPDV